MEASWEKVSGRKFTLAEYEDEQGKKRPEYPNLFLFSPCEIVQLYNLFASVISANPTTYTIKPNKNIKII